MKVQVELGDLRRAVSLAWLLPSGERSRLLAAVYRGEALEKGERPLDGPPWELVLPALRDVQAEYSTEAAFTEEGDLGPVFADRRAEIERRLAELEIDLEDPDQLYAGFVFSSLVTELLHGAYLSGACTRQTVIASARTCRVIALVLGEHLPEGL